MNKKCQGCGVTLQNIDNNKIGYTDNLDFLLCKRCFRIKHYNDYQKVIKDNKKYEEILSEINKTNDLVLYIVDITNFNENINYIRKYINNPTILVLNKRDLLPLSIKDNKIINYFKDYKFLDIILVGAKKNYNIDNLLNLIKKYKRSKNIYVVGNTNAGKSTLINKMIYNYSNENANITTSPLSSTTLDKIIVKLNEDITLIDTPGLLEEGSIIDLVDKNLIKKINIDKEIKPKTFRIYPNQSLVIDNIMKIDYIKGDKNSFTTYLSNNLKVEKRKIDTETNNHLSKKRIKVSAGEDIVIVGLGFIKVVTDAIIDIYVVEGTKVFARDSLIKVRSEKYGIDRTRNSKKKKD